MGLHLSGAFNEGVLFGFGQSGELIENIRPLGQGHCEADGQFTVVDHWASPPASSMAGTEENIHFHYINTK